MEKLSGEVTDSGSKTTQGKRRDSSGGASFSPSNSEHSFSEGSDWSELRQQSAHLRVVLQASDITDRAVTEE